MAIDRKEQILAAAYEIVGVEGLEGLHARSVAAKVGINHAAVHYYYPKRSDLLLAAAVYAIKRFASDREKLSAKAVKPAERIEAQLAQAEAYCRSKSRFLKNWASYFVAATVDEPVRDALATHLKEWVASLKSDIDRGAKTGGIKRASPFANAELLVCSLLGAMFFCHTLGPDFDAADKLDLIAGSLLM